MKGNQEVLDGLQMLIDNELAARDQYFLHSEIYKDFGLYALYERLHHEAQEEGEHAQQMVERMLFLEGKPDFNNRVDVNCGDNVEEMLRNDLAVEYKTINNLKSVVEICERVHDYDTRDILVKQIDDSEMDHAYFLEKQLGLIEMVGLQNYIQSQMGTEPTPAE